MAYNGDISVNPMTVGGHAGWCLLITETDAQASSETEIVLADYGLPKFGRIISQISYISSGAGNTVDPILGNATDPATAGWRMENDTAAARVHNVPATGLPYCSLITSFFHRSNVDTGTNNTIVSAYYFTKGWG